MVIVLEIFGDNGQKHMVLSQNFVVADRVQCGTGRREGGSSVFHALNFKTLSSRKHLRATKCQIF